MSRRPSIACSSTPWRGFNDPASFLVSTWRNARNRRTDANYDIGFRINQLPPSRTLLISTPGWTNGCFGFTLSATVGYQCQMQGSADLSN